MLGKGWFIENKAIKDKPWENMMMVVIEWLANSCWKKNMTHGDLTPNNLIVDIRTDGTDICIIDWFDTAKLSIYRDDIFHFYLFLDLYDIFNCFLYMIDSGDKAYPATIGHYDMMVGPENILDILETEVKNKESGVFNGEKVELQDKDGLALLPIRKIMLWMRKYSLL